MRSTAFNYDLHFGVVSEILEMFNPAIRQATILQLSDSRNEGTFVCLSWRFMIHNQFTASGETERILALFVLNACRYKLRWHKKSQILKFDQNIGDFNLNAATPRHLFLGAARAFFLSASDSRTNGGRRGSEKHSDFWASDRPFGSGRLNRMFIENTTCTNKSCSQCYSNKWIVISIIMHELNDDVPTKPFWGHCTSCLWQM